MADLDKAQQIAMPNRRRSWLNYKHILLRSTTISLTLYDDLVRFHPAATRFIAIIPIDPHGLRRSDKVRHGFHDSIHDLQDALRSLQSKDKNY